jgi:hypothetical protein
VCLLNAPGGHRPGTHPSAPSAVAYVFLAKKAFAHGQPWLLAPAVSRRGWRTQSGPGGDGKVADEFAEMDGSQLRRSQAETFQVPEAGIGFFAIPIMVLAGTPAGPPSAPRRQAAHQVRGIAKQQDQSRQGPGWVCEDLLYGRSRSFTSSSGTSDQDESSDWSEGGCYRTDSLRSSAA